MKKTLLTGKVRALRSIMGIPHTRLPYPRVLFTLDSKEPKYKAEIEPVLTEFAGLRIPLTIFVTNMTMSGQENYHAVRDIMNFAHRHDYALEIGSHGMRHDDLSGSGVPGIIEMITESLRNFHGKDILVRGFRAPFFSTENSYREVLGSGGTIEGLLYDSSISFGSSMFASIFNIVAGRKCPHRIGDIYELPVSALDDYHILSRMKRGPEFAYHYWRAEAHLWVRRLNYCMMLFHPHIIAKHTALLRRFLASCHDRYPPESFVTCSELVRELGTD